MRLDPKDDKKLKSNLKTLLLCSQFKTIQLSTASKKFENKQLEMLTDPNNQDLVKFLSKAYEEQNKRQNSEAYLVNPSPRDLTNLKLSNDIYVPENLAKRVQEHQRRALKMDLLFKARDEHDELRDILYAGSPSGRIVPANVDLKSLKRFLRDKDHTSSFRKFGDRMLHDNQAITLLRYKLSAKELAKNEEIGDQYFVDKINQTFSNDTIIKGINKEIRGRFRPFAAKVTAIAVTAFLAVNGAIGIFGPAKNTAEATSGEISSSYTQTLDGETSSQNNILEEYTAPDTQEGISNPTPSLPLSETPAIDTYEGAAKDLFNKVEEIYSYNTNGEQVNLSDLKYENIGEAGTSVIVANYNGKEYRFSTMSSYRTNRTNLERALEAAGATFTSYNTTISYLTRNDESIAIVDSQGNPVQSGKVLETSYGGGTEMYNQSWVNASKEMMRQNGVDPSGKSEAELVGYYLLNSQPRQNEELSRALGVVSPLIHYMKSTFYYRSNGQSDPYTVQQYRAKANKITQDFNNSALGITQNEQTQDGDER